MGRNKNSSARVLRFVDTRCAVAAVCTRTPLPCAPAVRPPLIARAHEGCGHWRLQRPRAGPTGRDRGYTKGGQSPAARDRADRAIVRERCAAEGAMRKPAATRVVSAACATCAFCSSLAQQAKLLSVPRAPSGHGPMLVAWGWAGAAWLYAPRASETHGHPETQRHRMQRKATQKQRVGWSC